MGLLSGSLIYLLAGFESNRIDGHRRDAACIDKEAEKNDMPETERNHLKNYESDTATHGRVVRTM